MITDIGNYEETVTLKKSKYRAVGIADGKVFVCSLDDANDNDTVRYIRGSGKYVMKAESDIWLPKLTEADLPHRESDGVIVDGTENMVWLIPYSEWKEYIKLNRDR